MERKKRKKKKKQGVVVCAQARSDQIRPNLSQEEPDFGNCFGFSDAELTQPVSYKYLIKSFR